MLGSAILDVAIGIIFVFLLVSLICSAVNEFIEAGLKNRAKDLEKGIRNLLANDDLAAEFYKHPLIQGLFSNDNGKPSYIPSRTFALTLLNIIAPEGLVPENDQTTAAGGAVSNPLANLRVKVATLTDKQLAAPIKTALLTLIDDAQGDVNRLRANVEEWYNAAMDRVAGWYKRRVQIIILFLGLGIAVALNVDTSYIARRLANDSAVRSALSAAAQNYAQKNNATGQQGGGTTPDSQQDVDCPNSDGSTPKEKVNKNICELKKLGLPLGWNYEPDDVNLKWPGFLIWQPQVLKAWGRQVQFHWLGWIVTAFAISLGSPFWFDMLNKIIVVRSTVKPREKSGEEGSKD
jgi:hypothetical protein